MKSSTKVIHIFGFFCLFCFYSVAEEFSFNKWINIYGEQPDLPSCERFADTFCESFLSAKNRGNFQFPDGTQILRGSRREGVISHKEFIHIQKVIKHRCHLPEDIKAKAGIQCGHNAKKGRIFSHLDTLLSQVDSMEIEQDSHAIQSWRSAIGDLRFHFENITDTVAYERARRENPHISRKNWRDYTLNEREFLKKHQYTLRAEIMNATYLHDPDWQRVVRVFEEVKKDILTVIDQLTLTPEAKNFMNRQVNQLTLSLPYSVPGDNRIDCNKYSDGAKYYPLQSQVVVCLGRINTFLSEGGLYGVLAHEVAHSIDPNRFWSYVFMQTKIYRDLIALRHSNSSLSCEYWEQMKVDYSKLSPHIYQLPFGLAFIDQCLVERDDLDEINPVGVNYASKRLAEEIMVYHASRNTFTHLTTPEFSRDGVSEANKTYLNPRLFEKSVNHVIQVGPFHRGSFDDIYVFTQDYKCRLSESDVSEETAFLEALEETEQIRKSYYYFYLSLFGKNADELIPFNLSKPSYEYFADWMSYKAIELKLKRESSIKSRRIFFLSGIANYCKPGNLERTAKAQSLAEHRYSRNVHPLNRSRMMGHFTSEIANLLRCNRGEETIQLDRKCLFDPLYNPD